MTAVAYLWMNRLGRLPQTPRVFTKLAGISIDQKLEVRR